MILGYLIAALVVVFVIFWGMQILFTIAQVHEEVRNPSIVPVPKKYIYYSLFIPGYRVFLYCKALFETIEERYK